MRKYVVFEKHAGETPLMAIGRWKEANPEYKDVPASYADRLDPMASGKLLVLLGEECKKQKEYTKLDKEYETEVLLDAGSDTGDALGLIEYAGKTTPVDNSDARSGRSPTETSDFSGIHEILRAEEGSHTRPYPSFSSKTVQGKPLFLYALEGTLDNIEVPKHEEHIYKIKYRSLTSIPAEKLSQRIESFLAKVPKSEEHSKKLGADFRIDAVRASWEKLFHDANERNFAVLSLRVTCGSGTYMRSLAPRIGEALGTRALALSINRTAIGSYYGAIRYLLSVR